MGDGRPIAPSMGTGAVISAMRPDSISDVSVSPLVIRLMFSSPFLSSLLISSSLSCANLRSTFFSAHPFIVFSLSPQLSLICPRSLGLIPQNQNHREAAPPSTTASIGCVFNHPNMRAGVYFKTIKCPDAINILQCTKCPLKIVTKKRIFTPLRTKLAKITTSLLKPE